MKLRVFGLKKDYDDGIKNSLQSGENLNIVLYLVYGNTNL